MRVWATCTCFAAAVPIDGLKMKTAYHSIDSIPQAAQYPKLPLVNGSPYATHGKLLSSMVVPSGAARIAAHGAHQ